MDFVISSLSNKNPNKAKNEDLVGTYDNVFWLLDGASNTNSTNTTLTTDRYVQLLDTKIVETLQNTVTNVSLEKIVATSIKKVADLVKHQSLELNTIPGSTIIVIRVHSHKLEYFVLGDSSLVIQINSQVEHISDCRLKQVGVDIRSNIFSMLRKGLGYSSRDVKKIKQELLQLENIYRNQPNGFYVASIDPDVSNHGLIGEKKLDPIDNWKITLMSDGLSRLVDTFKTIPSWESLVSYLVKTPALDVINHIRSIEHSDPDGQKFPRFRKHDDISMLMIQNK